LPFSILFKEIFMTDMTTPSSSGSAGGEQEFKAWIAKFASEASKQGIVSGNDENTLEAFIQSCGKGDGDAWDPALGVRKEDMERLSELQQAVTPELAGHPFFRYARTMAELPFSLPIEQINYAFNHEIQEALGCVPSISPTEEAVALIAQARKAKSVKVKHRFFSHPAEPAPVKQGEGLKGKYLTETLSEALARFAKRHSK
jgi:hypothetical protein